jgi:hypothetical protein
MTANLIQVLCKIDRKLGYEKRIGYFDEGWLSDEEIIELNPNDPVHDLDSKVYMRVCDTESYTLAAARIADEYWAMAEPLLNWIESRNPQEV